MKRLVTIVLGLALVVAVLFIPALLYGVSFDEEVERADHDHVVRRGLRRRRATAT